MAESMRSQIEECLTSDNEAWFNRGMDKDEAVRLLGGSHRAVAEATGVSPQAVSQWPQKLPPRIADRIAAALWRKSQGIAVPKKQKPEAVQ